ncbi:hypothetical protein [Thiocystis violascens]|uniref:Uncharacterized protein n=1 Tax=Thiocystis violascens (strain ATCC 17096 / DSM 198 / 6111) TaxID=765911 RepID=I3YGX8_THIV6|nr:hypothetical protein [Thiocystis violascens]AFL76246.1 hypothetical protein Thivi_4444 [Thiocystis violascens DSM 198]
MPDLGAIGELSDSTVRWTLPRNARSLDRAANPVRGILASDQAFTASFPGDAQRLCGTLTAAGGAGLARDIRALHRATGTVISATRSASGSGGFVILVPPFARVDLHILADSGDGCDLYLPQRTPVDG